MSDEGKRTEQLQFRVSERVALDLLRQASLDDRSVSDYLYRMVRLHLYGHLKGLDDALQVTSDDKVGNGK